MKKYFKGISIVICIVLGEISIYSQQIAPAAFDGGIKINYIRTFNAIKPYTSDADVISSSRTLQEVRQTTQYIDGLGRPIQTVIKKGSLVTGDTARDFVSPIVYDVFGREVYNYLPFAANNTGSNSSISDGKLKLNPFQQDSTFNKGAFSDESYYYNKTFFEASPLNRVLESYAAGNNWVGTASESSESNRRGIKSKYWVNTTIDSIRIWTVSDVSNSFGNYSTSDSYDEGELFKTVTQDEDNKQTIEFKDKSGNLILKKLQMTASPDTGTGKGYSGWLCTYYIYDIKGNLRCVVQPKGVELLAANSWSMSYSSDVILKEQCFRYEYDGKNRMIAKKVPGVGIMYSIYDGRDLLVMTQDSILRTSHKWQYTIYDALNRPTTTGLITDGTYYNNAAYHRGQADGSTNYPSLGSYTDEQLTKTFYDDYDWRSGEGNPLSATREDDYDGYLLTPGSTWPYPQSATSQSSRLRGLVTGSKTKILGTSTYLYTVSFFDDLSRVIQTQNTNITEGTDINLTQYTWTGQPVLTINKQGKAGSNSQTAVVATKSTFDDLSRTIKIEKKISSTVVNSGSMPGSWTTINENQYDALGQLAKKKLGTTPVDSLSYDYNIRGWILGMNRTYVKDTTSAINNFGYDLGYDKTSFTINGTSHSYTAAQYNGNIAGTLWRSTGDDYLRKYDFAYDATNRFLSADFNQLNSNSFSKSAGIDFSVSGMSYDLNGNITAMKQRGWKIGGSVTMDSLIYTYTTNTNKLLKVIDGISTENKLGDFYDGTNGSNNDYVYDANGNLNSDANKKISLLNYNHLNLPDSLRITGKGIISYTYDASGIKLKKVTIDSTTSPVKTTTTLYLLCNYVNDTLQFISTEEGRARIKSNSSAIVYDFMIKDHLGNVRMLLTEEKDTAFYPAASMETAQATIENTYYSNIEETRYERPDYTDNYTSPNDYAAKLLGGVDSREMIGPAIALRVMAGDKFNIRVSSLWKEDDPAGTPINPLSLLLYNLNNSVGSLPGSHATSAELETSNILEAGATSFLNSQTYDNDYPKAYVNWILFDEQFKYVSSGSGFDQVGPTNILKVHSFNNMLITKNGYLYIYVSNATDNINVYFDNLQVTHTRGPLLEENHYYPFGLVMNGISSKALEFGEPLNKKKFVSQEFDDELSLNLYQFKFRNYDPQIGRFVEIDPLADSYQEITPYAYAENKVVSGIDLEGLEYYSTKKGNQVHLDINIKVVNRSSMTSKEIKTSIDRIKAVTECSISGKDADGNIVSSTVNVQFAELKDVSFKNDIVMEFEDAYRGGKTLSDTRESGTTVNTNIEMASMKAWSDFDPSLSNDEILTGISETGAHEIGHAGGLSHIDDKKYSKKAKDEFGKYNLMKPKGLSLPTVQPNLTPKQLSELENNIPPERQQQ